MPARPTSEPLPPRYAAGGRSSGLLRLADEILHGSKHLLPDIRLRQHKVVKSAGYLLQRHIVAELRTVPRNIIIAQFKCTESKIQMYKN